IINDYHCSDELQRAEPWDDLGIYQYAKLRFVLQADGSFKPEVDHDTGLVAQANLATAGDPDGDGSVHILSPFSAWFANGRFKDGDKYQPCPANFGCGLRAAALASASHDEDANGAPDLMLSATNGLGAKALWDYYPLSTS